MNKIFFSSESYISLLARRYNSISTRKVSVLVLSPRKSEGGLILVFFISFDAVVDIGVDGSIAVNGEVGSRDDIVEFPSVSKYSSGLYFVLG